MRKMWFVGLYGWSIVWYVLFGHAVAVAAASRQDIEYWRKAYGELKPDNDPRAAKAHAIFKRLVQGAGKRQDVVQRLFITASNPWDIALPIVIQDGWIVLSKGALDLCYRDATWGDDRLAFVLAHEIAHQINDDLWHLRFAQAFEAGRSPQGQQQPELRKAWEEVQRAASDVERVYERELRADERGLIYTVIAGFNAQAIFTQSGHGNFFAEWVQGLSLSRLGLLDPGSMRPTPLERYEAIRSRLNWIADQTGLFHIGLWSYYAGKYPQAIQAFDAFRTVFPSREVFHNLGTSHHQWALQIYQNGSPKTPLLPFQLSLAIEPLTRASKMYLERTRGQAQTPLETFRGHLDKAIRYYEEALTQDGQYTPAALNLGAAILMRGVEGYKPKSESDIHDAVARLSRARDHTESPEILNNLGVAWFYDDHLTRAKTTLQRVVQDLAPVYAAPVYNLGVIAAYEGRADEARNYMHRYQQLIVSPAVSHPHSQAHRPESLQGIILGQIESTLPVSLGIPTRSTVALNGNDKTFTVAVSPTGMMTLVHDGEIVMLMARDGYQGSSEQGIVIGSHAEELLTRYGQPSRRQEMPHGHNWAYDAHRIAFQLRDGRVVSWLVF